MKHVPLFMRLTVFLVLVMLTGCARSSPGSTSAPSTPVVDSTGNVQPDEGGQQSSGSVNQGAVSTGSCVEAYSATTLKGRSFAFDGTITAVELRDDPAMDDGQGGDVSHVPWVTFSVNRWYKGGEAQAVAVWMPMLETTGAVSSDTSTSPISSSIGTRVLVAGEPLGVGSMPDQGIAWSCGFTRTHTSEHVTEWDAAFAP